ncbi:MAG: hypothetical protein ACREUO_04390 [Burkholderiales bacterium]
MNGACVPKIGAVPFFFAALLAAATPAPAQTEEARTLELQGGERIAYTLRSHPASAHLLVPGTTLAPTSALGTAKLLNHYLSAGEIEEAALLSNTPRRRYEVFRDYRNSIGEEEFRRVFAQYFYPENRLLAEIAIGRHHLLIWELKDLGPQPNRLAGQYFVEIEGRWLMDDVPSEARTSLRRVLEAFRAGKVNAAR